LLSPRAPLARVPGAPPGLAGPLPAVLPAARRGESPRPGRAAARAVARPGGAVRRCASPRRTLTPGVRRGPAGARTVDSAALGVRLVAGLAGAARPTPSAAP